MYNFYKLKMLWSYLDQGSSLTFSLAGQSGQPKSGLAGPQLVWLARDTFIGFGQPIIITLVLLNIWRCCLRTFFKKQYYSTTN